MGRGGVTASTLAAERDELPPGLGLSFISKRRQMVGLALAPSPQSPKVCFRDGCGERERCRGGRGTSARADNGGGGGCSEHVWAVSQSRRAGEHITLSLAPFGACFLLTFAGLPLSGGHISKGGQRLRTPLRLFIKKRIDGG